MKNLITLFCLFVICLLPVTTRADVSGEIVLVHPVKQRELWITHLNVGGTTHQIYEHEPEPNFRILDVVTQKGGKYIAFLARSGDEAAGIHLHNIYIIYIFNKYRRGEKALNITQNRFGEIDERGFDISKNGDIVFASERPPAGVMKGIYLIPRTEFQETAPRATMLVKNAYDPVWFPDGERIAFVEDHHIYILTVATGEKIPLNVKGYLPTVSPNGQYIALTKKIFALVVSQIDIHSLSTQKLLSTRNPTHNSFLMDFKWAPDDDHLVFTTLTGRKHHVMSFNQQIQHLGKQKDFLDQGIFGHHIVIYDWTHSGAYSIDSNVHITTLWGKLKM